MPGLLDFLFPNAAQQQPAPLANTDVTAQPANNGSFMTGLAALKAGGGISDFVSGLTTGQRTDPVGAQQALYANALSGPGDQASKIAKLTNVLLASGDVDGAKKLYEIANGDQTDKIKNFKFGMGNPAFAETLKKDDQPSYGLNPVPGVDANGNPAMVQLSDRGTAMQVKFPQGFSISKSPLKIDTGTGTSLIDPITRQPVGAFSKDVAGVAREKETGDAQGKAQVALPQIEAASQQMMKTIDDVGNHPGKAWSLGKYSMVPTLAGTTQANFRSSLAQLKGQTFLTAYQTLRGGGAITDIEGSKGENAVARLNEAQTVESFDSALKDLKDVVSTGIIRAKAKARGPTVGTPVAASSSTNDPLGLR